MTSIAGGQNSLTSLIAYLSKLGLPQEMPLGLEQAAQDFLGMAPGDWRKLSAEDCGEAAVVLLQLAFFLQNSFNEENCTREWAQENIRRLTATTVVKKPGYSHEERLAQAVLDQERTVELDKIRVESKLKCERIAWLAARVDALSRALLALQASKRGRHE